MNSLALILAPLTIQFAPTIYIPTQPLTFHRPDSILTRCVKNYFFRPIENEALKQSIENKYIEEPKLPIENEALKPSIENKYIENDYIEAFKLHPDFFQLPQADPQQSKGPQSLQDLALKKIMQNPHLLPRDATSIPEQIRNKIIDCMRTPIAIIAKTELMRFCCYGLEDLNGKYLIDDQYNFISLPIISSTASDDDGATIEATHSFSLNPSERHYFRSSTKNYPDGTRVINGFNVIKLNTKNLSIKMTDSPEKEQERFEITDMFYQHALDGKLFSKYTKKFKADGTRVLGNYTLPFLSNPLSEHELIFLFKLFAFRAYKFDFKQYDPSIHPSYQGLLKSPPETAEKLITQWNNSSERFACITAHQKSNEEFNNQVIKAITQASEKAQVLQKKTKLIKQH